MSETIFLHIGANKTGSSAIQSFFNLNRDVLAKQGVLYPLAGCVGEAHYGLSTLLGFVHGKHQPIDLMSKPLVEIAQSLKNEILSCNAESVVISSESFVLPKSVETVRSFFSDYDVKVVVYVRRHDKWLPSSYNQAVRMVVNPPWGRGFKSYVNFHKKMGPCPSRGDYRLLLERWAKVFGKDNMIIRPYERQQNQPNIFSDFMRAIGRADVTDAVGTMEHRVNDSVDMGTLAYIEAFQRAKIDQDVRARLIKYVLENRKPVENCAVIDPALLLSIVEQNNEVYEYIAREYLGRDDGRLFYDPLPDASSPWKKIKQPSPADVVELVVRVMAEDADERAVKLLSI